MWDFGSDLYFNPYINVSYKALLLVGVLRFLPNASFLRIIDYTVLYLLLKMS